MINAKQKSVNFTNDNSSLFCISGSLVFADQKELDSTGARLRSNDLMWAKRPWMGCKAFTKLKKAFAGLQEINTLLFYLDLITIEKMQDALKFRPAPTWGLLGLKSRKGALID